MKIPKRYATASMADWKAGPFRSLAEEYLGNFHDYYEKGLAPLLLGQSGTGKTHGAATIFNTIQGGANESLDMVWFSASEVFNQIIDAKDLYMKETYVTLKSSLRAADFLVLDDISAVRPYARLKELFWNVLEHRYAEMKPTLLTANYTGTAEDLNSALESEFGAPIARRMMAGSRNLRLII